MRSAIRALAGLATGLTFALAGQTAFAQDQLVAAVTPAVLSSDLAQIRQRPATASDAEARELTPELLASYVARQQHLRAFKAFEIEPPLTEETLLGYIARQRNPALEAISAAEADSNNALNAAVLAAYVAKGYLPTGQRTEVAEKERLCLTQAIYHEARGESTDGQWAVVNVIINRAMSGRYPSTLCGVIFENAENGRYRCQFTFACDGRSDQGTERNAWRRAEEMARIAYAQFAQGDRPDVVPSSTLYYHTRAVSPSWSRSFRRVAAIGAHIFYSP